MAHNNNNNSNNNPSRSPPTDFYSILGITTSASSIKEICKAYKSLVTKKNHDHKNNNNNNNDSSHHSKHGNANETTHDKGMNGKRLEKEALTISEPITKLLGFDNGKKSMVVDDDNSNDFFPMPRPKNKSKSTSNTPRRSKTPTPTSSLSSIRANNSESRRSKTPNLTRNSSKSRSNSEDLDQQFSNFVSGNRSRRCTSETQFNMAASCSSSPAHSSFTTGLSRDKSKRSTTPIVFSQSTERKKPPPVERKLECTLEELLDGCLKKIIITRNVIAETGIIVQKEETLWVNIKPGWKKGTKITFEGKGDEKPGFLPADIILCIEERRHPLYERVGDDLEIVVEIPLVNALTGCSIPIPLLGGDKMTLSFDDIIYHGYEKVIKGQGMPNNPKEHARRGDLRIKFLVEFPVELSNEQRAEAAAILQDSS